ncbi:hypothetical protein AYO41_03005 [Verrucomicrobia bacterium SCGC AG-212-E04]|nr:hypothetical protein AYO41_03005 [Verrucomicrobia bacterium SCGC AG-212-E04]
MKMQRWIPPILFACAGLLAVDRVQAQVPGDGSAARAQQNKNEQFKAFDLNGDGVISDYEVETVLRWQLLNPELKLSKKERKALAATMEAQRKAEIKKYDLNGDGKLDEYENKLRLADQEKKRKEQKKSKETQELSKPMIEYLAK